MQRAKTVFLIALVFAVIAFVLGHFLNAQGIRSRLDAEVAAQDKIENRN